MKIKLFYLLFFSFLISSCSSQNFNNEIINSHLEEEYKSNTLKKYIALTKLTTKEVIEIYEIGLNNSGNHKEIESNSDSNWVFSKDEILTMRKQSIDNNKWNSKGIKISNNFEIVDESNIEISRALSKNTAKLFYISDFLLNNTETKALQGIKALNGLNIGETYVLVYVKENNKWIQINKIYSTELH